MLTPSYLSDVAEPLVELWSRVECDITADIARRLTKTDYVTETAKWQVLKAREMGMSQEQIVEALTGSTAKSKRAVRQLVEEACAEALHTDVAQYRKAGLDVGMLDGSNALRDVIRAGERNTNGLMSNFTRTIARTANRAFENSLDLVWMQTQSGAFSLDQALRNAISDLSKRGITSIAYPSGHVDKLDVAARRASVTGINQAACQMQLQAAEEMGSDLVEVTSHAGARPSHALWQGGIYSLSGKSKKFKPFRQVTGYGTGEGLGGWNCRHNFFPYFPGISEPTFGKDPNRYLGKSNDEVYEESQKQRELERSVRESRRSCSTIDAAASATDDEKLRAALKEDFESESLLLKRREAALKAYCNDTGRTIERDRMAVMGYNKSVSGKARAAAPRAEANELLKQDLRAAGIRGKIHLSPTPIDANALTFDDAHINAQRGHHATEAMAKSFVRDAQVSVSVWGGQFERYYAHDGAAYVSLHDNLIRTAYTKNEFDDGAKAIMEALTKHGK